jgi:hypothetical protein
MPNFLASRQPPFGDNHVDRSKLFVDRELRFSWPSAINGQDAVDKVREVDATAEQ